MVSTPISCLATEAKYIDLYEPISFRSSFNAKPDFCSQWMLAEIMFLMVLLQVMTLCYMFSTSARSQLESGLDIVHHERQDLVHQAAVVSVALLEIKKIDQAEVQYAPEAPSASSSRGRQPESILY